MTLLLRPVRPHPRLFATLAGLALALLAVLGWGPGASRSAAQGADAPAELVGQLGGPSMAVAIRGETLYLGVGPRIAVFDIGDPSAPVWETSGPALEGMVLDMVLGADHLYVATDPDRVDVFTIEDDGSLAHLAHVELRSTVIDDLQLDAPWIFVAGAGKGLRVVDVGDPANPRLLDPMDDAPTGGKRAAVTERQVHLLDAEGRLHLIDRGVDGALTISRTLEAEATEIALFDDRLALVHLDQNLRTYDLQDIAALRPLAEVELTTAASSLARDGSRLYVGTIGGGIEVFDASDPASLSPVAELTGPGSPAGSRIEDMAFHGGAAFAAARMGPALPRDPLLHAAGALLHGPVDGQLQQLRMPSALIDAVEVTGRTAWIAEGFSAGEQHLTAVDLVDPRALRAKPELPLEAGTRILALAGNADTLYVRVNQGLLAVDGATAELKHKGFEPRGSGSGPMRLWHHLLVIASGTDLSVFDVSRPHEPRRMGEYLRLPAEAVGMEISPDGVAYIAFEEGWALVSLREPGNPQIVRGSAEGRTDQLAGDGTRMFSLYERAVRMLEPRALRPPVERWSHDFGGSHGMRRVVAGASRLYGLSVDATLSAVDIVGPFAPRPLRGIRKPAYGYFPFSLDRGEGDLTMDGDNVIAAVPGLGLWYYRADTALGPGDREGLERRVFLPRVMRGFQAPKALDRRVLDPLGTWRSLDDVSSIGLAVQGGRAYVGLSDADGAFVAILDVADPSQPRLLGRSPALDGVIDAIAVEGARAYVASAGRVNALHVLDVSNPAAPRPLGHVGIDGRGWKAIASGGRVYLSRPRGVAPALGLDAEPPAAPIAGPLDSLRPDTGRGNERDSSESCSGRGVLCIVDAGDPNAPRVVGGIDPGPEGDIVGFDLLGTRLVAADLELGLRVFDVANPAAPVEIGRFDAGAGSRRWVPHDVSLQGSTATVVTRGGDEGFEGLWLVDLGNPAQPGEIGSVGGMEGDGARLGGWRVETEGDTAFVRTSGSLLALDIGEPAFPRLLDEHEIESTRGRIGLAVENGIAHTLSLSGLESFRSIAP